MPENKPEIQEDTIDNLLEISRLLDLDLNTDVIRQLTSLTEQGYNPEALAIIVKELQTSSQEETI